MNDRAPSTLSEALTARAEDGRGRILFHLDDGTVQLTSRDLAEAAQTGAAVLASHGVKRADPVGLLGPNHPSWVRWAFSAWGAGATLVPLPLPVRIRDADALIEQVERLVRAASCRVVVADPELLWAVPKGLGLPWDTPAVTDPWDGTSMTSTSEAPAVFQFTSGSTASPKGVVLSHRAVLAGLGALDEAFGSTDHGDRLVGWQPFFHDLGLFGYAVRPIVLGLDAHIMTTERFARDPAGWFRLIGTVGATLTSGPASAWAAALRAANGGWDGIDLSTLRVAVFAAEAIDPAVVDRLREEGGRHGLSANALVGAYGLAEATLGVSAGIPGQGLRIDEVDLTELAGTGRAVAPVSGPVRRIASSGRPMPGAEVRIAVGADAVPDRSVGEIQVRALSLMDGYLDGGSDPFADGWLRTGDLGFLADGELFVTGRQKDVVVVLGRNYAPEEIEWGASRVEGVRPGRCVAFARPAGSEGEMVVALEAQDDADPVGLVRRVRAAVAAAVGITPREVLVLAPGTILKTTSGKLRRSALREAYERGDLDVRAKI